MALRRAAASAMGGRKWYEGPVGIALTYWVHTDLDRRNRRYLDGVMDTLGGSHGRSFIYLPIVYLDDCQVSQASVRRRTGPSERYELIIEFL